MNSKKVYDYNVAVLNRYGNKYKLTLHNVLRRKGVEYPPDKVLTIRGTQNKNKLNNSIARSRNKMQEYILCSHWSWFVTFTIDKNKYDRYNLKEYYHSFSEFIHNLNKGKDKDKRFKYVSIPEMHKDGAWHLHSVVEGLSIKDLKRYTYEDFPNGKIPLYILKCLQNDKPIYYWKPYVERYGYITIRPVENQEKVANYVCKYFTKDISKSVTELNSRLFYSSHGLKGKQEIKRGHIIEPSNNIPQYQNDYISVSWIDEVNIKSVIDNIEQVHYSKIHDAMSINQIVKNIRIENKKLNGWHYVNKDESKILKKIGFEK
jgi:hypothetical protein